MTEPQRRAVTFPQLPDFPEQYIFGYFFTIAKAVFRFRFYIDCTHVKLAICKFTGGNFIRRFFKKYPENVE